jgi:hypothetical protein
VSPEEFLSALEASRRFEIDSVGATFTLVMPTEYAARVAVERANGEESGSVLNRQIVEAAIVGWSGVKLSHLLAGGPDEELPFSKENVALLLEHRQRIADELASAIAVKFALRRKKIGDAKKNSGPA